MIGELNYNYWGIPEGELAGGKKAYAAWDSSITVADIVNETIWGYYYVGLYPPDYHPENIPHVGKPFDTSVYYCYAPESASYASNAAFNIEIGNTLNVDVAINRHGSNVPLAMGCPVKNSSASYVGYWTDPSERLAYDESKAVGYPQCGLCFNIYPNKFCVMPAPQIFDESASPTAKIEGKHLSAVKNFIDANPSKRNLCMIRMDLYIGENGERHNATGGAGVDVGVYIEGQSRDCTIFPDNLAARPIPASCTPARELIQDGHDDWVDDKVFSPFLMALRQNWGSGKKYTTSYQMNIGAEISLTYNVLRNGGTSTLNGQKVIAQFMRFSDAVQTFDDVVYQWQFKIYDVTSGLWIEPGMDITNKSGTVRFMTLLNILDTKGESKGEATVRAIKHEVAFLGLYFANNDVLAAEGILGTAGDGVGIFLPEIIEGVTTGNYFTGEEIQDVPYADATDTSYFRYNGDSAYATDNESHIPSEVTAIPRFGKTYLCDMANIENVMYNLKTFDWSQENLDELFFGQNPYDFIISASAYPFVDYPLSSAATLHDIELGKVNLNTLPDKVGDCQGYPIMGGIVQIPNPFGTITAPLYYSKAPYQLDFLDYEPYTAMYLYLPYCGMVSIPPSVFMGKEIAIDMSWDTLSGTIVCYIKFKNNGVWTEYTTAQGNVLTEIPVSGRAYSDYAQLQLDAAYEAHMTALETANAVTGNLAGASVSKSFENETGENAQKVMAGINFAKGLSSAIHTLQTYVRTAPSPVQISNGSSSLGTGNDQDAHLYILRPILPDGFDIKAYTKINGKATGYAGKLSSSSGFTQMINPILDGINCTAEEKMLIINALANGVIL